MPVHDWSQIEVGIFQAFRNGWITHLGETLKDGLLPNGYYALSKQPANRTISDVLTLHVPSDPAEPAPSGGVAVSDAQPRVRSRLVASEALHQRRRTLTIRHGSGHRIIALLEILSPAKKDRPQSVEDFVEKTEAALRQNVHMLMLDLFPRGAHDPRGMHGPIWSRFDDAGELALLPEDEPVTLASFVAARLIEVNVEHAAFGTVLPPMPLFLSPERTINVPLESTYEAAFRGMPSFWRGFLEERTPPAR